MSRSLFTNAQPHSVQVSHKEAAEELKTEGEAEPLTTQRSNEETEEENVGDEDCKVPLELLIKFLGALMDENYQVAGKLCEMILIFEPENPEASEFLPLIQRKLQEGEQKEEQSEEEEEEDDANSESDERSSSTSSSSSSSCSSSSSDDEGDDSDEEEEQDDEDNPGACDKSI